MKSIDDYTKLLLKNKDLQNPNSFEELGYIFYGPLLFNFFIWLKSEVKNSDLLLFNSREGYFLKDIYELFRIRYNLPTGVYFKTSRKISSISALFTKEDIYKTFELHRYSGSLSNLMKDRFGIECEKDDYVDSLKEIPNIDEYVKSILENSKRIRNDYKKYINNIVVNHNNIVMIDSGYQGTTQYNLQKAFGLYVRGRYINYKGNKNLLANQFKKFIGFKKNVLEVGCGTGQLSIYFSIGTNNNVVGLDPTIESLNLAKTFVNNNDINNLSFVRADIFDDVLSENFFDFIWCSGVLHHTKDPYKAFKIIINSLKP